MVDEATVQIVRLKAAELEQRRREQIEARKAALRSERQAEMAAAADREAANHAAQELSLIHI